MSKASHWSHRFTPVSLLFKIVYLFAALAPSSCGSAEEDTIDRVQHKLSATAEFTLALPPGLGLHELVGAGWQRVNVGANAQSQPAPGASSASILAGSGGITAEPDAKLRDVWSPGPINLRDRVLIKGNVHGPTYVPGNSVNITGAHFSDTPFQPVQNFAFSWTLPTVPKGSVSLEPGQTRTITPGSYGTLRIKRQSKLRLSSGVYRASSIEAESLSMIIVDQRQGPVWLVVDAPVYWRSKVIDSEGGEAALGMYSTSSQASYLETPFSGAFLAPSGQVTLRSTSEAHRGFFYARTLAFDAGSKVVAVPPSALLLQTTWDSPADCVRQLGLRGDAEDEFEYQLRINRYCAMPGEGDCVTRLVTKTNMDATSAAWHLIGEAFSPARYLSVVRDRMRKLRAAQAAPVKANALCSGSDPDGDMVPAPVDTCPGTAPLVATTDDGCPVSELPPAPAADDVQELLSRGSVMLHPRCGSAQPLPRGVFGSFYQPANRATGTFLVLGRVFSQPSECPVWYVVEVEELEPGAPEPTSYIVAFGEHEASNALAGLPKPVPPQYIQFNPLPTDPGTRGRLGDIGGRSVHRFRIKVVNGAGSSGGWSDWVTPSPADCKALGFDCE